MIDVPGHADEYDVYNSKITGLYSVELAVDVLVEIGGTTRAHITVGSDGLSVSIRAF